MAGDGEQGAASTRWGEWITASSWSFRVDVVAAVAAASGLLIAALIIAVVLLRGGPLPGLGALLAPAFLAVFAGQGWAILVLLARRPKLAGGRWSRVLARRRSELDPRSFLFPGLPAGAAYALVVVFVLAWVLGMTAFPALSAGNPTHALPGCRWPLENHGAIICVSHARYQRAGAAVERLFAGVMMGFFTVHLGVSSSELLRRRGSAS